MGRHVYMHLASPVKGVIPWILQDVEGLANAAGLAACTRRGLSPQQDANLTVKGCSDFCRCGDRCRAGGDAHGRRRCCLPDPNGTWRVPLSDNVLIACIACRMWRT